MRSLAIFTTLALASTTALASQASKHYHELARRQVDSEDFDGFWVDDEDDKDGWNEIDYSVMLERDTTPAEISSLMKRTGEGKRDLGQSEYAFPIDRRTGELQFPRSWDDVKNAMQTIKRSTFHYTIATITWYTGHDLLAPACWRKSRWTPTDSSLIAAVTEVWPGKPACGSWLKLRPKGSSRSVVVRVWDACGGCQHYKPHVDLTKTGFSKLYSLSVGESNSVETKAWYKPFSGSWNSKMVALYGPPEQ